MRKLNRREKGLGLVLLILFLYVIILISGKKPTTINPTEITKINQEIIVNLNKDKNDCTGDVPLGVSKETQEKIISAAIHNDNYGLIEMLLNGEVFLVENCTKVQIVDEVFLSRKVRILEGKNIGKSGWLPENWIK